MAAINPVIKSFSGCLPLCFYVPINEGLRIAITLQYAAFAPGLPRQIQWLCSNAQRDLNYGNSRLAGFTIPTRRYFLHKIIAWFQTKKINSGTRFMCGTWP